MRGDLAKYHFEFDNATYEELATKIELIVHCGGLVNFVLPYETLYDSNVSGTREIIRPAAHSSTRIQIQYISTMSVLPAAMTFEISIENIPSDHLKSGYAQSKWVTEKLITRASHLGLSIVIYRLGSIGAHTKTGACNLNAFNTSLISIIMKICCYPLTVMNMKINELPVNFAGRRIICLSRIDTNFYGSVYHITNKKGGILFQNILEDVCDIQIENILDDEW